MPRWILDRNRCKGCGLCVEFCKPACLELSTELNSIGYRIPHLIDPDHCTSCKVCAEMCPETALSIYRPQKKVKEK